MNPVVEVSELVEEVETTGGIYPHLTIVIEKMYLDEIV
jgi:hypothetical protein